MKVAILSNQARSMANFWRVLMENMRRQNMDIVCIAPAGDDVSDGVLKEMGAKVIHYDLDRKGVNPLRDVKTCWELKKIFLAEKPDLLFATTIKPVIYGSLAANAAGVKNIFATITGLGYAFEADSLPKKIINRVSRLLYRQSLKHAKGIFFQNQDDMYLFRNQGILEDRAHVLFARGTGVDTQKFAPAPLPPVGENNDVVFLLIGRLLEAKGIADYAQAAASLKKSWPNARFLLLGQPEPGPGGLSMTQIREWEKDALEYVGETADVRPFITQSHVIVLPSWREGTPTAVMEAMSMGRPCVVTDVPGCREVVTPGENGWLAGVRNPVELAEAMEKFLLEPQSIAAMGKNSRKIAEEKFDAQKVAQGIIADMKAVMQKN